MIELRQRKCGATYRVKRLEGRLTATFRHRDAAELQDALWGRWGDRIPVLADQQSKISADLLARLTDPRTPELGQGLLTQLLAKHPVRHEWTATDTASPLLGEYLCNFFELWKEDDLPGRPGRPKSQKNARMLEDALHRLIFKTNYVRDDRSFRVRNEDGKYIAEGWGAEAIAWTPVDRVTPKLLLALDKEVKQAGVGQEIWRKVLNLLQQMFDHALVEEVVASNPVRVIKKPPQNGKVVERQPYLPDTLELIRADFLRLGELAKTRVRGRRVKSAPGGVPVPEIRDYGEWSADFAEALGYSGCRPGELLAAEIDDVDGQHLTIVRRSVDGVAVAGTKSTAYPEKTVFLLGPLANTLARRAADARLRGCHLLFPFPGTGRAMTEEEYRRWRSRYFAKIARARGLGPESDDPYALRHVYASLRAAAGHPVTHIEASMGSGLVSSTYAKVFREYEGKPLDVNKTIDAARQAAKRRSLRDG